MKTETGRALLPYRRAMAQMPIGAVVVERALSTDRVTALRARLDQAGLLPFRRRHLGCYERLASLDEPELIADLHELAEYVTDKSLARMGLACLRLRRGDYLLSAAGEPDWRSAEGDPTGGPRGYELTLDLSAGSSGEAQVVYARNGEHFFAAPQLSGSVAIVERRPSITRYDRYLNHRIGERVVHRLRLALRRSRVAETEPPLPSPAVTGSCGS